MKAKRRLSETQVIRDLRGMKRIIGASVVDANRVRDSNKFKFAEASHVNRRSAVAYVGGPVGIVNGACGTHANLESMNYNTVRVIPFRTIEKGEELTLCYDINGAVEISGASESVLCSFGGCEKVIIK